VGDKDILPDHSPASRRHVDNGVVLKTEPLGNSDGSEISVDDGARINEA
jgi:hypothetical protein